MNEKEIVSNVVDSMSVEEQVKRLWKWAGELSVENKEMKKQILRLSNEILAMRENND